MDQLIGLRVFVIAVETGSLASASRQLDMAPVMAGRYFNDLERRLQVRLLHRSTRHLALTDAGQRYYDRCKLILAELADADREAADQDTALLGRLKLSAPVTFGSLYLSASLARFHAEHPGVQVQVMLDDRHVELLAEGVDLAVRIGHIEAAGLVVRRIASCPMVACASPAYLDRHAAPTTPAHLADHTRLAFVGVTSPGDWTFTAPDGSRYVAQGKPNLESNNIDVLRAAAETGMGIVYGPAFAFTEAINTGRLVTVLANYITTDLPIHAVFPAARYIPRIVRQFVERLAADMATHFAP